MTNTNFWQEKIKIGTLEIPRIMAAPLDGITDSPLRQLIRHFSKDELLMGEMRHVACVSNERDGKSVTYDQIEHPLAYQFSANKTDFIAPAVEKVIQLGFVMINLNSGCPAPTVTKSGSGSALMANLPKLEELIKYFVKTINGRVPFTLKIRAGFKVKNAVEVAIMAEANGVECLMIHPRTQPEFFASRLDFDLVKQVKAAVKIPVVFSGNINSFMHAQRTYDLTNVDGFMIGRALWGAPWKIREITDAAQGKTFSVDTQTMLDYAIKHLDLNMQCFGAKGYVPFKKQLPQYIRGIQEAAEWRAKLLRSQTETEMRDLMHQMILEYKSFVTPVNQSPTPCIPS